MRVTRTALHAGALMLVAAGAASAAAGAGAPDGASVRTDWAKPTLVSPPDQVASKVALETAAGTTTYAWIGDAGLVIVHRTAGEAWSAPQVVDAAGSDGNFFQVVGAPSGTCIAYPRWRSGPRGAVACSGPDHVFGTPVPLNDDGFLEGPVRLVVDGNGVWTLGWLDRDRTDGSSRLEIQRRSGAAWSDPLVLTSRRTKVRWFDLDTSPQGVLTVAWQAKNLRDPDARARIRERTLDPAGRWSRTMTVSGPGSREPVVSARSGQGADIAWIQDQPRVIQARSRTARGWGPVRNLSPSTPRPDHLIWLAVANGGHGVTAVTWTRYRPWQYASPDAVATVIRRRDGWSRPSVVAPTEGVIGCSVVHVDDEGTVRRFWCYKARVDPSADDYRLVTRSRPLGGDWSSVQSITPSEVSIWSDPSQVVIDDSGRVLLGWLGNSPGSHAYLTVGTASP